MKTSLVYVGFQIISYIMYVVFADAVLDKPRINLRNAAARKVITGLFMVIPATSVAFICILFPEAVWGGSLLTVVFVLYGLLLYKDKLSKRILTVLIILGVTVLSDVMVANIVILSGYTKSELQFIIISCPLYLLLMAALFRIFAYTWRKMHDEHLSRRFALFLLLPASQLLSFGACCFFLRDIDSSGKTWLNFDLPVSFLCGLMLVLAILISFVADEIVFKVVIENIRAAKLQAEMEILQSQNKLNYQYYTDLKNNAREMRSVRHDINNILQSVYALLQRTASAPDSDEFCLYNGVVERMKKMKFHSYSENELVNAILSVKQTQCETSGIEPCFKVVLPPTLPGIDEFDLCRSLVNILDNAVEASQRPDAPQPGKVNITIFSDAGFLFIRCENTCADSVKKNGKLPKTTKPNPVEHGFGVGILEAVAEKYHGELIFDLQAEHCCTVLTMKLPQNSV